MQDVGIPSTVTVNESQRVPTGGYTARRPPLPTKVNRNNLPAAYRNQKTANKLKLSAADVVQGKQMAALLHKAKLEEKAAATKARLLSSFRNMFSDAQPSDGFTETGQD